MLYGLLDHVEISFLLWPSDRSSSWCSGALVLVVLGEICRCAMTDSSATLSVYWMCGISRCWFSLDCPFLWWSCGVRSLSLQYGERGRVLLICNFPLDSRIDVSLVSTALLISIVSFPSNDGGLPRLEKSLSRFASTISSGFDRDRNTSISIVPIKLLRYNCIDSRLSS